MSNVYSTRNENTYIEWLRIADMLENIRSYETLTLSTSKPYFIETKEKELKEVPPDGFEQMYI